MKNPLYTPLLFDDVPVEEKTAMEDHFGGCNAEPLYLTDSVREKWRLEKSTRMQPEP